MNINNSIKLDVYKEVTGNIFERCTNCNLCKKECGFLQKYGTPGEIAGLYNIENSKFNEELESTKESFCR